MNASPSEGKYLDEVYRSVEANGHARVSYLAKVLGLSVSGVSKMIGKLTKDGYIHFERYGIITLTEKGKIAGKELEERRLVLVSLFRKIGLEAERIDEEVHNLKYTISQNAVEKIKDFLN
ncbi:metal-dependent transcriptional regulator [Neobacillus sp. SCS-31]|uniref:metal-dependent transcriptional regulator n=1 Tax=Neobacillus oceani TaxID=3115292 RepID=UPI003905818F